MKKKGLLVALMMVSTIIFAQHRHGDPKAMAAKRAERLKTELALNDDQYSRVKAINEKSAELRADTALSVGTMRNRMQKLRTEQEAELKGVLTSDQWTKYNAMKARRMEEWKSHKHGERKKG